MLNAVLGSMEAEQGVEAQVRLGTSPAKLLSPESDTLINNVLNGADFKISLNIWKKLGQVFEVISQQEGIPQKLTMAMMGLSPAVLLRMNANLEVEVDQEMRAKLEENPMLEPVRMNAYTLMSSMARCSDDEEIKEAVENMYGEKQILYNFLMDKVAGTGGSITFLCHLFGAQLKVESEGLELLPKSMVMMTGRFM